MTTPSILSSFLCDVYIQSSKFNLLHCYYVLLWLDFSLIVIARYLHNCCINVMSSLWESKTALILLELQGIFSQLLISNSTGNHPNAVEDSACKALPLLTKLPPCSTWSHTIASDSNVVKRENFFYLSLKCWIGFWWNKGGNHKLVSFLVIFKTLFVKALQTDLIKPTSHNTPDEWLRTSLSS